MRWQWLAYITAAALCGCSTTAPVAVITKSGQVLRGSSTASLAGGSFTVSDGPLICGGTYDSTTGSPTISVKVTCNDGRSGFAIVNRERGNQSGSGRLRLTDGTEGDFVFGQAAAAF